ncbi:MAG: protein kinase [Planctomycetota bacterium]|nr:protein kinase [Planctomycetota bacterium]
MSKCPFCETDLTRNGLRDGRCPSCSSLLEWQEGSTSGSANQNTQITGSSSFAPIDPTRATTDSVAQLRMTLAAIVRRAGETSEPGDSQAVPSLMDPYTSGSESANLGQTVYAKDFPVSDLPGWNASPAAPPLAGGDNSQTFVQDGGASPVIPNAWNVAPQSPADSGSSQVPPRSSPTVGAGGDDIDLSATIDSVSGPFPGAANSAEDAKDDADDGHGTFDERRLAATMDSAQFTRNETDRIAGMWKGTYSPSTTPRMTIKGSEDGPSTRDSRLVIKQRNVQQSDGFTRTGADYELLEVIGEGGVGVVYAARQASIDRTVAIKMLKPSGAISNEQREKFLSEAVVTGDLDHPNIVPIYDLGTNEGGALFYSMKRVQGTPWISVLNKKLIPENLEILMKVADAVGFAHSRGVIHRDLKPENVMLGDFGEVLVMDWGLAMSTAEFRKAGSITQSGSMGGTPAYMAPEMATGPIGLVTAAADVYLLGAILYEIITGQPPHTGKNVMNCLFAAARNDIQPTTQSGELLEIAMKAMSTNPADRYTSSREFQMTIREYQSHSESITLSNRAEEDLEEATRSEDYQSYSRALFGFQEAAALWDGNTRAVSGISDTKLAYAKTAISKGDFDLAGSLLDSADPAHTVVLRQVTDAQRERNLRQQRLRNAKRIMLSLAAAILVLITGALLWVSHLKGVADNEAEIANQQRAKAMSAEKEAVKQKQNAEDQTEEAKVQRNEALFATKRAEKAKTEAEDAQRAAEKAKLAEEYEAYIARIGLAAAKVDENAFGEVETLLNECGVNLRHWEWGRLKYLCGRALRSFTATGPIDAVALSADGKRFVSGGWDGTVRIWNSEQADKPLKEIPYGGLYVHSVAYSPDGRSVAAGGNDQAGGYIKIFDVETGDLKKAMKGHTDTVVSLAFSKDGSRLLSGSWDNTARLWDVAEGTELRNFGGHSSWVWSAAFSPDEKQIVTASQDGTCIVRDIDSTADPLKQPPAQFTGHQGPVYTAAFSPDGEYVASGGYDKQILVWRKNEARPFPFGDLAENKTVSTPQFVTLSGHSAPVRTVRFLPNESKRLLLSGSHDNTLKVWHIDSRETIQTLRGHAGWVRSCDVAADGLRVLSGSFDWQAKLWNLEGYEEIRVLQGRVLEGHSDAILAAAFSRSGQEIVTASRDRTAKTWDFKTGHELRTFVEGHEFLVSSAAFLGDGRHFLTSAMDSTVRFWDLTTGTESKCLEGTGRTAALALSHNRRWILTGGTDHDAKLWDATTGQVLHDLKGHRDVSAVAFSPDDKMCVTCDIVGRSLAWDTSTGEQLWESDAHTDAINAVAFLPNGSRVLTASNDNAVAQFDAATGKEELRLSLKHPAGVLALAVTPDGQYAVTSCADKQVRVFETGSAELIRTLQGTLGSVSSVAISPDGQQLLTVSSLPFATGESQQSRGQRSAVQFWNVSDWSENAATRITTGLVWSAIFAPDEGQVLLVGGNGARLWKIGGTESLMSFAPHGALASASFSPDGKRIVTGSWDNSAKIWNASTGRAMLKLAVQHTGFVNSAVFSPDGKTILTASDDKTARLWNAETGEAIRTLAGHTDRVRNAEFSANGQQIVTASSDKSARIWNVDGKLLGVLSGHKWPVICASFNQAGTQVVTSSDDNTAKIWDAATYKQFGVDLGGHTASITSVCFSPDGSRVLTGSQDNTAKLWDSETCKEILTLKGHTQEVTSVSFSTDGRYVLTGSRDGTAIVWLADEWRNTDASKTASEPITPIRPFPLTNFPAIAAPKVASPATTPPITRSTADFTSPVGVGVPAEVH